MKELKIKLYSFNELSEEVKNKIADEKRWDCMAYVMEGCDFERAKTLEKFCDLFNVRMTSQSIDYCGHYFNFEIKENFEVDSDEIKGRLLRRFINSIYGELVPRKRYYLFRNGKCIALHVSRVNFNHDGCPLTGVCYDADILDKVWEVYGKVIPSDYSLKDLVNDCLTAYFNSWQKEYEYWGDNDEAIKEELSEGMFYEKLFYSDGTIYNGPIEKAA